MSKKSKTIALTFGVVIIGICLALVVFFQSGTTTKASPKSISVYLAGDSTVSNYPSKEAPRAGWGQVLHKYFTNNVIVKNDAISGRSSKSFIDEGALKKILNQIKPNDYLLIQFGHNDEKKNDSARYTNPDTTFKSYLKQYIDGARKHKAIPILITPVARRDFDKNGKIVATHGKYPQAMKDLGKEENVPVIDLSTISQAYFGSLGAEKTKSIFLYLKPGYNKNYPKGAGDDTHFQENGANAVAKIIINELKKSNIGLKNYILK